MWWLWGLLGFIGVLSALCILLWFGAKWLEESEARECDLLRDNWPDLP